MAITSNDYSDQMSKNFPWINFKQGRKKPLKYQSIMIYKILSKPYSQHPKDIEKWLSLSKENWTFGKSEYPIMLTANMGKDCVICMYMNAITNVAHAKKLFKVLKTVRPEVKVWTGLVFYWVISSWLAHSLFSLSPQTAAFPFMHGSILTASS